MFSNKFTVISLNILGSFFKRPRLDLKPKSYPLPHSFEEL